MGNEPTSIDPLKWLSLNFHGRWGACKFVSVSEGLLTSLPLGWTRFFPFCTLQSWSAELFSLLWTISGNARERIRLISSRVWICSWGLQQIQGQLHFYWGQGRTFLVFHGLSSFLKTVNTSSMVYSILELSSPSDSDAVHYYLVVFLICLCMTSLPSVFSLCTKQYFRVIAPTYYQFVKCCNFSTC